MSAERREGPRPPLFPIPPQIAEMTTGAVRFMAKTRRNEQINRMIRHHVTATQSPAHTAFLKKQFELTGQMPFSMGDFYALGAGVALDATFQAGLKVGLRLPTANWTAIRQYCQKREHLIGKDWQVATPEVLFDRTENLRILYRSDHHAGMQGALDGVKNFYAEDVRRAVQQDFAYVLGLTDGYIPLRYADEIARMKEEQE